MKTKRKNKSHILLGSFIILLGIALPLGRYLYYDYLSKSDDDKVEEFFEYEMIIDPTVEDDNSDNQEVKKEPTITYNYVAVLEIPSISLKRGFLDKKDKNNNVNKNIQILSASDMPDKVNGNVILASHSGSSHISFFKNLDKVKKDDSVYIYYKNKKYTYKVVNIYEQKKDGTITIHRNNKISTLTLTTCNPTHKGYQLIVISELIKTENY